MPGLFVTFEGGEGTGKSTQIERLARRVRALGADPFVTREPGGTPLGERIRSLLLDPTEQPSAMTEVLLMEASRAEHVANAVRPALEQDRVVLCDRYADSTLAYQGAGRGIDATLLASLNRAATGGLSPELTLLYDLEPSIGIERRQNATRNLDRLDRESIEFHRRGRERFLYLARAEPRRFVVLDATLHPDRLEAMGWEAIVSRWTS